MTQALVANKRFCDSEETLQEINTCLMRNRSRGKRNGMTHVSAQRVSRRCIECNETTPARKHIKALRAMISLFFKRNKSTKQSKRKVNVVSTCMKAIKDTVTLDLGTFTGPSGCRF